MWVVLIAIIVIVVATIIIRNSRKSNDVALPISNNNQPPVNNTNSNTSSAPVNTNTDAYIHGKSVRANGTIGNELTKIYKKSTYGLSIYTTVPRGTYIGVADKFDTNKDFISVFIPETWDYMLVQASQVKIG